MRGTQPLLKHKGLLGACSRVKSCDLAGEPSLTAAISHDRQVLWRAKEDFYSPGLEMEHA